MYWLVNSLILPDRLWKRESNLFQLTRYTYIRYALCQVYVCTSHRHSCKLREVEGRRLEMLLIWEKDVSRWPTKFTLATKRSWEAAILTWIWECCLSYGKLCFPIVALQLVMPCHPASSAPSKVLNLKKE